MRNFNKIRKMLGGAQLSLNPNTIGSFNAELPTTVAKPIWSNELINMMHLAEVLSNELTNKMGKKALFKNNLKNFFTGKANPTTYAEGVQLLGMANNYMNEGLVNSDKFNKFNLYSDYAISGLSMIHPAAGMAAASIKTLLNTINLAGAKTTDSFSVDELTRARMGGGYTGLYKLLDSAASRADLLVGLFSRGEFNLTQDDIALGKKFLMDVLLIDYDNQLSLARAANTLMNAMNYANKLNGGIDFNNMRIGRLGFKLENLDRCRKIKTTHIVNVDTKRIEEFKPVIPESTKLFKEGGNIEKEWKPLFIYLEEPLLKKQKDNKYKDVYDFYKDYDLSKINIIEGSEAKTEGNNIYITNEEDLVHELLHYISQNKPNEIYKEFYDSLNDLRILELGGDLLFINRLGDPGVFYHPSELEARIKAAKYKTRGLVYTKEFFNELRLNPEKYGYNMRDLLYMYNDENLEKIFNLKKGGSIKESDELVKLEETNQKNVIPEGALHKNKHHIEYTEEYTQKGIPVVDNDGELQAEVELNEIIFTLEVTKKLEELHKIYKEGSKSDLDKAAVEAGKLLVLEILYNTIDRTGLISKCENGGKL